jgi:hypothetical protein
MRKPTKWGILGMLLAVLFGLTGITVVYATNPWDTVNKTPGCSVTGCNACGSYDNQTGAQCAPKDRFCTWKCGDGLHKGCLRDDAC